MAFAVCRCCHPPHRCGIVEASYIEDKEKQAMSSSTGQGDMGQQSSTSQSTSSTMGTQMQANNPLQNLQYDLVSTLYHACKSNAAIGEYIRDANQAGNSEAAQFFQMVAQQDQQRAQRAQELLNQLSGMSGGTPH
jgi:rubrerythrin